MTEPARTITQDEVHSIFEQVSNWGRWGDDDERGTLNLITSQKLLQAASLVSKGESISCSLPLNTQGGAENANPVTHTMIRAGDIKNSTGSADYFSIASHGLAHTHLDALCHIFYRGQMYNGRPAAEVTSAGALANSIEAGQNGIVSRGVFFDMPRLVKKEWMEPGEAIYAEDLAAAEEEAAVKIEPGDILLIRTGRHTRRAAHGPGNPTLGSDRPGDGLAGLHATSLPWLHERGIAVLGCDGLSDVAPSGVEGGGLPIHSIIIPSMGVHLLDNAQFDSLAEACERHKRWQFMFSMAPLRLQGGTASPVNPVAIF